MDDARGVRPVENRGNRSQILDHTVIWKGSASVEQLAERLPGQQRHLDNEKILSVLDALHWDDVRILKRRRYLGLALHLHDRIGMVPGHLDRDVFLVGNAGGTNDDAPATESKSPGHGVAAVKDTSQLCKEFRCFASLFGHSHFPSPVNMRH
jgi:hypothetical protein